MSATVHLDVLRDVRIASACSQRWEDMDGDEKRRHCEACGLFVHNLSAMTTPEIESLMQEATGRVCGRLFRREDGTILTADCPVGLARLRAGTRAAVARGAALVALLLSAGVLWGKGRDRPWDRARVAAIEPFRTLCQKLSPAPPPIMGKVAMGDMCVTPRPSAPPTPAPSGPAPVK